MILFAASISIYSNNHQQYWKTRLFPLAHTFIPEHRYPALATKASALKYLH
jgi:hypothetical protein